MLRALVPPGLSGSSAPFNQNTNSGIVVGDGAGVAPGVTLYGTSTSLQAVNFADGVTGTQQYEGSVEYDHSTNQMYFRTFHTRQIKITNVGMFGTEVAGAGFTVKEGSNAKMGTATLVTGAAVVATTAVTANSRIFLTSQVDAGTVGFLRVSTRTAGTSFTITSSNTLDLSTVAWLIFEPTA